uniref:Uncharacterized protein n=2 Tax=unclassified Caudoviricetes TaxID=2788787 RepID=A0A8S5N9M2_9CAUD|nr:MAG TPA: hypothetical protein [Siphoviridae sp. ctkBO7]DAD91148.1 MAG TPA: hypothetical protein [Siphoviridae sp. ctuaf34]
MLIILKAEDLIAARASVDSEYKSGMLTAAGEEVKK